MTTTHPDVHVRRFSRPSLLGWLRRRHADAQATHRLRQLDPHLLRDIGLERVGIADAVRGR